MSNTLTPQSGGQRSPLTPAIFCGFLLLLIAALIGLGIWQVERLSWKLDLIARVDARVHAESAPPPGQSEWAKVNAADDEYRRVKIGGTLQNDKEALVYASTALGPGYWVMTPLVLADGTAILINRGFVPTEKRDPSTRAGGQVSGPVEITGLMRMSEPKGSLLQSNDPAANRWYSRDVSAIAASRGIDDIAPYFIDADATPNPDGLPIGGLTIIDFPNNHLVYAITWFVLALMVAGLLVFVIHSEIKARNVTPQSG
jgi:surfeit locus 1 family protein